MYHSMANIKTQGSIISAVLRLVTTANLNNAPSYALDGIEEKEFKLKEQQELAIRHIYGYDKFSMSAD